MFNTICVIVLIFNTFTQAKVSYLYETFPKGHHKNSKSFQFSCHQPVFEFRFFVLSSQRKEQHYMKITLLVVGRTVDGNIIAGIKDYTQRLSHFAQFDIEVIPELKNAKKLSEAQQKEAEGELILKALQAGDRVVLLDEGGKEFRSTEFAAWIEHKQNISTKRLVFIVGGPYGFAQKVYDAAHEKLSLSKMTFSHQMIRLLFVEQLYRAYTIINHLPYHHE